MRERNLTILAIVALFVVILSTDALAGLQDGLIAYYPFNGNANDETGNGHDGTVYGATLMTDRFGNPDSAYGFDGIDDYIEAANPEDFGFINQSFSVSVWAYVIENRPVYESFVGLGSTDRQYCVNKWRFGDAFYTEFDHGSSQVSFYPDGGLQPDTWYHLVSVVNMDSGDMEFYGDGILRGINGLIEFDFSLDTVLRFGMRPGIGDYLLGVVDDVRIYNRALTAAEVQQLYESPEPPPVIEVAVDIKPQSCPNPVNVKSSGVLPAAILGSEDFDVNIIDVASIRLLGIEPLRSSYEDVAAPLVDANDCECTTDGPDGFLDLTLKFKTQRIVEAIGDVNDGDVRVLTLTGVLFGPMPFETPIEGADCILIRGRHKPFNKADINKDGVVNTADFAIVAENWLQSSISED